MDWTEIKISVPLKDSETAQAIANMTVPYGIYVEDYSDLEKEAMEIAHVDLIDEELIKKDRTKIIIHIYIVEEENAAESVLFLNERLNAAGIKSEVITDNIAESDWADNWKKFFKTTEIGEKLVIRPMWEEYKNTENRKILSIDPGAAFGTGTHATTRMCLELLEKYIDEKSNMLDIGTGSGILSIASALLGAKSAVGVDIDKVAVRVAGENAELNNVGDKTEFIEGDLCDKIKGKYNVICANIVADAIISLCSVVEAFLDDNGIFICSGIINIRENDVKAAFIKYGYIIVSECEQENWRAFAVRKDKAL